MRPVEAAQQPGLIPPTPNAWVDSPWPSTPLCSFVFARTMPVLVSPLLITTDGVARLGHVNEVLSTPWSKYFLTVIAISPRTKLFPNLSVEYSTVRQSARSNSFLPLINIKGIRITIRFDEFNQQSFESHFRLTVVQIVIDSGHCFLVKQRTTCLCESANACFERFALHFETASVNSDLPGHSAGRPLRSFQHVSDGRRDKNQLEVQFHLEYQSRRENPISQLHAQHLGPSQCRIPDVGFAHRSMTRGIRFFPASQLQTCGD